MKVNSITRDFEFLLRDHPSHEPNHVSNAYFQNAVKAQNILDHIKNIILGLLGINHYQHRSTSNRLLAFQITNFILAPYFFDTRLISVTDRTNNNILIGFRANEIIASFEGREIVIAGHLPDNYLDNILTNAKIININSNMEALDLNYINRRDLRWANLTGADLTELDLRGANLINANLRGANLTGANLRGADLINANLTDANLTNANLTNANLRGAGLINASLTDANLTNANLTNANLRGANLTGADLTEVDLRWADLTGADLTEVDLTNAGLTGADLRGANLTDADLTGANLRRVDLTNADLTEVDLRGVNLTGANLRGVDLTNADLRGANLRWVDLTNANLTGANLRGVDLTNANLTNADLTNADLTGANLQDIIKSKLKLEQNLYQTTQEQKSRLIEIFNMFEFNVDDPIKLTHIKEAKGGIVVEYTGNQVFNCYEFLSMQDWIKVKTTSPLTRIELSIYKDQGIEGLNSGAILTVQQFLDLDLEKLKKPQLEKLS